MPTAVQKWGNSLGLRIPAAIAEEMHIKSGTRVTLKLDEGVLLVRVAEPARRRRPKYKLKDLLDKITPANVQPTYSWGRMSAGKFHDFQG